MRHRIYWVCLCVSLGVAQPQPAAKLLFDAVSVKPADVLRGFHPSVIGGNPGRITFENFSLKGLIREAYGVSDYQVAGPSWIGSSYFDVVATKPAKTAPAQTRAMLRSMLEDRFHLATHTEKRAMQAYSLLPGKDASKLRPEKDAPSVAGCHSYGTLDEFAGILAHNLQSPVVNKTGISGTFYFILAYRPDADLRSAAPGDPNSPAPPPPPPASAPPPCPGWTAATMPPLASSIFDAVKDQMGLRLLREGTAQVEVIVVDRADRLPTAN